MNAFSSITSICMRNLRMWLLRGKVSFHTLNLWQWKRFAFRRFPISKPIYNLWPGTTNMRFGLKNLTPIFRIFSIYTITNLVSNCFIELILCYLFSSFSFKTPLSARNMQKMQNVNLNNKWRKLPPGLSWPVANGHTYKYPVGTHILLNSSLLEETYKAN